MSHTLANPTDTYLPAHTGRPMTYVQLCAFLDMLRGFISARDARFGYSPYPYTELDENNRLVEHLAPNLSRVVADEHGNPV